MQQFRYGIMPYMIALALVAGLMMMQPHLSGTLLISLISITLIFVGGARLMHFAIMGIAGAVGIISVVLYLSIVNGYGYFQTRIQSWLDPFADSLGGTWQTCQSLIAIGSGGFFGLGLGESVRSICICRRPKTTLYFPLFAKSWALSEL